MADSNLVRNARNMVKQELLAGRSWLKSNWTTGSYGKFRVAMAVTLVLLAVHGLFGGWSSGTSETLESAKLQKGPAETEAGTAFLGFLHGGGGSSSGSSEALGIAKLQKEAAEAEAGMAFLGSLLGGNGSSLDYAPSTSQSSGPKKHTWMCNQCGNTVESVTPPPRPQCRAWHGQNNGSCYKQCNWRQTY